MSTSTPYELRFKILEMARDMETHGYERKMEASNAQLEMIGRLIDDFDESVHVTKKDSDSFLETLESHMNMLSREMPEVPSTDSIKKRASELYEFVLSK
jgi:hypothetical protein